MESGNGERSIQEEDVLAYAGQHRRMIDGICITGGEPLLQDGLTCFLEKIKSSGFKVKVDTNGSRYDMLQTIIQGGLVDYVAMDVKGPPGKIARIAMTQIDEQDLVDTLDASIRLLKVSDIEHEFRTTVVPGLLTDEDFESIGQWITGGTRYVLQQFRPGVTLDPAYSSLKPEPPAHLESIAGMMIKYISECFVRGSISAA